MPTYTPKLTRSPIVLTQAGTAGDDIELRLFIWNDPDSEPATATESLSKPIPSTLVTQCEFDIAPYLEEYINHTKYTAVTGLSAQPVTEYCFCTAKVYKNTVLQSTTYYMAFSGYSEYSEGQNPTTSPVLLDEGTYYFEEGTQGGGITIFNDLVDTWTVVYTNLVTAATATETLISKNNVVPMVYTGWTTAGNTVDVKKNGITQKSFRFEPVCEPKYTVVDCDFVNSHGAWFKLPFFKASSNMFNASGVEFNLMPEDSSYNSSEARRKTFNRNARKTIKCNTGFVPEAYESLIRELLMSEVITINDVPVKLVTQSLDLQKHINKKLINYEVEFEYAYNQRQYVL